MEYDPMLAAPIVKEFEVGPNMPPPLKAYLCPAGVWTIGWGHTKGVRQGQTITIQEAEAFLLQDLIQAQKELNELCKVPLTQGQFIGLTSFVFNIGITKLRGKTIFRLLNAGDYQGAANEFPKWKLSNGVVLGGLVRRREAERKAFLS